MNSPANALIKLLSIALLAVASSAHADTYHRFWRGVKSSSLSTEDFVRGLNQVFIPATVQVGADKGMIAYEPMLTNGMAGLPDEVALVSYEDKPAYDALYSTDAGKAYQNLHWQYFDRSSSHSLMPGAYSGSVAIEQAYDLRPGYADWQKHQTTVLVYLRRAAETDSNYLGRVKHHLDECQVSDVDIGVLDRAVLVAQGYWLEYVSAASETVSGATADYILPVTNETPATARISAGSGINLQF